VYCSTRADWPSGERRILIVTSKASEPLSRSAPAAGTASW
jgi:hypothetical protein